MKGFTTFIGVGGLATAIQYALMIAFVEWLESPEIIASASAYGISAIFNYIANYYLTFNSNAQHRQTLPKFILATSLVMMLNTLLFSLFFKMGFHYLIAQVIATIVTLFVNFAIHKLWIYRK